MKIIVTGFPNQAVDMFRVAYVPSIGLTAHHPNIPTELYTHDWVKSRAVYAKMDKLYTSIVCMPQRTTYKYQYRDTSNYLSPSVDTFESSDVIEDKSNADYMLMMPCNTFVGSPLPIDYIQQKDICVFTDMDGYAIPDMIGYSEYGRKYLVEAIGIVKENRDLFRRLYGNVGITTLAVRLITGGIKLYDGIMVTRLGSDVRFEYATSNWMLCTNNASGTQTQMIKLGEICHIDNVLSIQGKINE